MLRSRVIPCLLIRNKGLVKTVKFKEGKYVGDPLNAVKIFNEKEVDELIVLDIDATRASGEPDFHMIEKMASECRMPFCYGGGVTTKEQARKIISLGVEKVALSASIVHNPELVREIAREIGGQSVVAILDVKKKLIGSKYEIWTHNATKNTGKCPVQFARVLERMGVGEIVVNSINNDGVMKGYDLNIVRRIRETIKVPMTVLGGAGSVDHIKELVHTYDVIGAAAGSLFVFKGSYKAVLINYLSENDASLIHRLKA
ncbi:imidazole glycerol phosphate synthase subunit HisF [Gammaproteobacteria bacterium 45_16_T64]|nr:imidazole glycerol phosphate synthase subunit HisF [Gammaproteobacteria bacterium 45_16_T64]